MSVAALPLVLGGGAAAAVVASRGGQTVDQTPEVTMQVAIDKQPTLGNGSQPGATTSQLVKLPLSFMAKRNSIMATSGPTALAGDAVKVSTGLWGLASPQEYGQIERALQEKLDLIKKYGAAAYSQMTDDAKKAAAAKLSSELNLDPPLDGSEDWETIAKIAGGAAGLAAFGWLPGGAVWGPIVGAYLGIKIEELISKNADEIKAWFKSTWGDIEDWITDTAGDVGAWFGDIF